MAKDQKRWVAGVLGLLVLIGMILICRGCGADQMAGPTATVVPEATTLTVQATATLRATPTPPLATLATPRVTPVLPAVREPTVGPAQSCNTCYPEVCIPLVSGDLNCKDVPDCHFRVISVKCDRHRFDGDRDGIGCEVCWQRLRRWRDWMTRE